MTDTVKIRELNDRLRTTLAGGQVVFTGSLGADRSVESMVLQHRVLAAVRVFNSFTADNDPYGEHDFGTVEIDGEDYFFKIEYYDKTMTCQSEHPEDPAVTERVMSIFRASDY